jgi:hypothetical protein
MALNPDQFSDPQAGFTPKYKADLARWKQNKIDKDIRETNERHEYYKKLREENQ